MTPLKANIVRMTLSVVVIILCVLGLLHVFPSAVAVPIAMGVLGVLNIFNGVMKHKEQKEKSGIGFILFGIVIILFAILAPLLQ